MSNENDSSNNSRPLDAAELGHLRNLVDRNEIRRTYADLLRRFSPETHPAEFQQIRAAYETAIRYARSSKPADDRADKSNAEPPQQPASQTPADFRDEPQIDPTKSPRLLRSFETSQDQSPANEAFAADAGSDVLPAESKPSKLLEIWSAFSLGPSRDVVRLMEIACEDRNASTDAFVMLFWMEKLRPDFGSGIPAYQVLVKALRRYPADWRLHELLSRETCDDLRATTLESFKQVNEVIRDVRLLTRYLELRWSILCERSSWVQLRTELEIARPRISFSHRPQWIDLLLTINEYLVLSQDFTGADLLKSVVSEIGTSFDLLNSFRTRLEYLDVLNGIRAQRVDYKLTDPLSRLVTSQRHSERTHFVRELFTLVRQWVGSPIEGLNIVSRLGNYFSYAFWLLRSYLSLLPYAPVLSGNDSPELLLAFRSRFRTFTASDYKVARLHFLLFCRDECISFSQLLSLLQQEVSTEPLLAPNLSEFEKDLPLQVTCECIHSFLCSC